MELNVFPLRGSQWLSESIEFIKVIKSHNLISNKFKESRQTFSSKKKMGKYLRRFWRDWLIRLWSYTGWSKSMIIWIGIWNQVPRILRLVERLRNNADTISKLSYPALGMDFKRQSRFDFFFRLLVTHIFEVQSTTHRVSSRKATWETPDYSHNFIILIGWMLNLFCLFQAILKEAWT